MNLDASPQGEQTDLRDYARPVLDRWWLVVLIVAVVTAATYLYYDRQEPVYEASTQLFVSRSEVDDILFGTRGPTSDRELANSATLVTSNAVARRAARMVGFEGDPRALLGSVSASASEGADFILITARGGDARATANLANAFARAFVRLQDAELIGSADRALQAARSELEGIEQLPENETQRGQLLDRIQRLQAITAATRGASGTRQIDPAVTPAAPVEPDPKRSAIFAAALSLAFAIALCFALERLDRRIKRPKDASAAYGVPLLIELPWIRKPTPRDGDGQLGLPEPFREPYRRLRTSLELIGTSDPIKTLLVSSAAPREGKSTTVRGLAIAWRQAGQRVLVIDADLRRSNLAALLGADQEPGLAEVLTGERTLDDALQDVAVDAQELATIAAVRGSAGRELERSDGAAPGRLALLAGGKRLQNPTEALAAERMRTLLDQAAESFDLVLIDTPPLLAVSDAVPLLSAVDGVVIVTRMGVSTSQSAERLREQLDRVPDARILGVIANGVSRREYRGRAYSSYYG